MELKTSDRTYSLKLDLGETLIIEFCPLKVSGLQLGFTVSTMRMPGSKMAIAIRMPDNCTFKETERNNPLVRYLIHNPNNADKTTFVLSESPRHELAVKKVTIEEA